MTLDCTGSQCKYHVNQKHKLCEHLCMQLTLGKDFFTFRLFSRMYSSLITITSTRINQLPLKSLLGKSEKNY